MIDNLKLVIPLLTFDSSDDFYYLQILQRKKENDEIGSNSRIIKNYYIGSVKYLEDKYEEIKGLCDYFNARAYIRLNKRSYKQVAFKALSKLSDTMLNKDYVSCSRSYDKVVGALHNEKNDKRWIVDVDSKNCSLGSICDDIDSVEPNIEGTRIKKILPSKNGYHIICNPFNLQQFSYTVSKQLVEIHKDNPTNLYIPYLSSKR